MINTYNIVVEETGEVLRPFHGDYFLDVCISTWERMLGKKVIAVLL